MSFFSILEGFFTLILAFYVIIMIVDVIYDGITSRKQRRKALRKAQ